MKSSGETRKKRRALTFPREVLLVEIERRCADATCDARIRVGLTKEEARLYDGFACDVCERRHADSLTERDIPDWWEELTVTGLATLRGTPSGGAARAVDAGNDDNDGGGGVVTRLSEAWRSESPRRPDGANPAPGDGGDESL